MMMRRLGLTTMAAAASMRGVGDSTSWQSVGAKLMEVPKSRTGASRGKGSAKDSSSKRSKSKDGGKQSGRDSKVWSAGAKSGSKSKPSPTA
jgi:hypothetical protein